MGEVVTSTQVPSNAYLDQKPGTSGLRKPTSHFLQPNYIENFIQSILNSEESDILNSTIVVGGDGRYGVKEAVAKILKIAPGSGVSRVLVGQHGILSTPAASCIIRKYKALGGILLTASHNPGGPDADFGIKYNTRNGGPAPDKITEKIFEISKTLSSYHYAEGINVDIDTIGIYKFTVNGKEYAVEVIDSVTDYLDLMKEIFDFPALKEFLKNFPIHINCMNAVSGPYATRIFIQELSCPPSSVVNNIPLTDFGGLHPDPNLTYAAALVQKMESNLELGFGAAYDGDGDRNMVIGNGGFFVNPSDSLAVLLANLETVKWFGKIKGVARSMPTSMAVDRVAQRLGLECYEVPTGWKYFGNLMDADKISICGEESFGTGSVHIREKDGIWTSLLWLSLLSSTQKSVSSTLFAHWAIYGRNYYGRHDYENVNAQKANELMSKIGEKFNNVGKLEEEIGREIERADNFKYVDPVDGSVAANQGLRLIFKDGSRVVWRLSGTGSQGATVRVYLEKYEKTNFELSTSAALEEMVQISLKVSGIHEILGVDGPTVIT